MTARIRVGTSGWDYRHWKGRFYPATVPRRRSLEYASRRFDSIEINGSFYSLQRPESYRRWYAQTPRGFVFALKGSRFITHDKKLRDVETPLANFFASGLLLLREKLGPIVWQFPSKARFDEGRMRDFLTLLPRDTRAASLLARRHDDRVAGRSWTRTDAVRRLRHAIEARNASWFVPSFVRMARSTNTAIVFSDAADWPYVEELTAGFVYLRLHGGQKTYGSRYGSHRLERWARRIRAWQVGGEPADAVRITELAPPRRASRDVYVYFDNDWEAHAPADAIELATRLGTGAAA